MATKPRKPKSKKKPAIPATRGASLVAVVVGSVLNMTVVVTTVGSVLLGLMVASHFA